MWSKESHDQNFQPAHCSLISAGNVLIIWATNLFKFWRGACKVLVGNPVGLGSLLSNSTINKVPLASSRWCLASTKASVAKFPFSGARKTRNTAFKFCRKLRKPRSLLSRTTTLLAAILELPWGVMGFHSARNVVWDLLRNSCTGKNNWWMEWKKSETGKINSRLKRSEKYYVKYVKIIRRVEIII